MGIMNRLFKEATMVTRSLTIITLVIAISFLMGCGNFGQPNLDKNWGKSYQQAKAEQTVNPDAGIMIESDKSYDGNAAKNTVDAYHKQFSSCKKEENVNIIKLR
jgi:hypothetical protein